ncbi:MAG: glycosyltransferase family 2 protein [Armatimonadota bacterium]|nr:MAG: glycosyltransferase family 2 protein [Armatimonadota bacterium]
MTLSVIIPVYNESSTILETIARVRAAPVPKQIIVVDDASTDATPDLVAPLIASDLKLLRQPHNQGKGAAIRRALTEVTGDIVLIQDADLEYDPADYPALIAPILSGEADVVYGTRAPEFRGMSWRHRLFNWVAARLANLLYHAGITDEATCYKVFRADLLRSLPLRCQRFEFCPEVTAKVRKRGVRIHEVPVHYQARTIGAGKKIRWWDGVVALWALIKYRFTD